MLVMSLFEQTEDCRMQKVLVGVEDKKQMNQGAISRYLCIPSSSLSSSLQTPENGSMNDTNLPNS